MSKIYFKSNTELIYDINLLQLNRNCIQLVFTTTNIPDKDVLLSGFYIINEHNRNIMADKTDYNFIYREYIGQNKIELSNNGSVYVEPEIPEPIPIPEPEPYIPTEEEKEEIFRQNKSLKISESKYMLEAYLMANPLVSVCHGGKEGKYSVTVEKQSLMANNYLTYTIEKQAGGNAKLTWNETGKECEEWTESEYIQLLLEASAYVKPLVSRQQKYEVLINECATQEQLDQIVIDYTNI